MKGRLLALATAVALALCGAIAPGGSAGATEGGPELSMEEIVDIVNAKGLGEVYEVERERDGYEVKVEDAEGVRTKLYVDSRTGEILHQKRVDADDSDDDDDD